MSNYTKENAEYMCKEYTADPCMDTVDRLGKELDKPRKSIIGKLSREGVYRRSVYKTKTGDTPITKIELTYLIAQHLELEPEQLLGLDKTPKLALKLLELTLSTIPLQRGLNDQHDINRPVIY